MTTLRAGDVVLAAILFVAACVYLVFLWPHNLVALDEGMLLYESKRILEGQVMYRDFFELWGPVANYALALMYALFGVSMETARNSTAVLHAVIVVLVYAILRRLGVRPLLAAAVSVTHIALFYPMFAFASPHWLSTALTLMAFLCALRAPVMHTGHAVALGSLTALVGLTQQPKGVGAAAAVAIVLIRDAWTARRVQPLLNGLVRQLGAYAIGLLGVLALILGGFVLAAGFDPVFDALVRMPLGPYRQMQFVKEGGWFLAGIDPALLRRLVLDLSPFLLLNVMPFIIPIGAAWLVWQVVKGQPATQRRPLFVAVVFSACAVGSVFYHPSANHFAVVGPVWLSVFGAALEGLVGHLEALLRTRLIRPLITLVVFAALMLQLHRTFAAIWKNVGVPSDTPFGRVHFRTPSQVDEIEALRTTLHAAGVTDILVYPYGAAIYLMTETSNPTRFQLLLPDYNTAEQFAEAQETLEREQVQFVVRCFWWWGKDAAHDPLMPYLREHYDTVRLPRKVQGFPTLSLLRRKTDTLDTNTGDRVVF